MKLVLAFAIPASLIACPTVAEPLTLHPGETVTVRMIDGQTSVEASTPAEPITKFEAYVLWRAERQDVPPGAKTIPPAFIKEGEAPPNPTKPLPGRIQLTMRLVPGPTAAAPNTTALFIANGYGSSLTYRAVMVRNGRSKSTDVCEVRPNLVGLEYWPYVLDQLDLSDFHLEEPSDSVTCK